MSFELNVNAVFTTIITLPYVTQAFTNILLPVERTDGSSERNSDERDSSQGPFILFLI